MATVSTSKEIEKSSRETTVSSKSKNRMTSLKTAVNDTSSSSHGIRNPVSTTETCLFPSEDMADAGQSRHREMKSSVNENGRLNSSPFTIRNFVLTVRGQDFSKCWPFRHKILERCLNTGLKLELPPFDPPPKSQVCLGKDAGQEPDFVNGLCEQIALKTPEVITHDILESSKEKPAQSGRSAEAGTLEQASDKPVSAIQEMATEVECQLQENPLEKLLAEGVENAQLSGAGAKLAASSDRSYNSKVMKLNNVETGRETKHSLLSYAAKTDVMEEVVELRGSGTVVSADVKASCTESEGRTAVAQNARTQSQNPLHSEIGTEQTVEADSQFHFDQAPNIDDQHPKIKCQSSSERCRTNIRAQKLAHMRHVEPREVSECRNQCQNDYQESNGGRLQISDVTTAQTFEHELMGEQNRVESSKSGENFNVAVDSEVLAPQLCPVCLSFTSTSNTALNAHIDHCLATVLPGEKSQGRFQKNRIKARKMRSMADICATAPSRTLEDLELSCQLWALDEDTLTRNVPCALGWSDGLVRRQPRTPLYRGPGGIWKGNGQFVGESDLQQILPSLDQSSCECAHKKHPVAKAVSGPSKLGISSSSKTMSFSEVQECQAGEQSNTDGACLHGSSKFLHFNSLAVTIGMTKKNKIIQNPESLRVIDVVEAVERLPVDSIVPRHLGKSHTSKTVNASVHCNADEVSFGKSAKQSSVRGSSLLHSSSERVDAYCDTDMPVAYHDTAALGQLELAATKGKIPLDPVFNSSCGGKGSMVTNKRRKRKNGVMNLMSLQDVPKTPERTLMQDLEPSDHSWSETLGFHGIIPVDTSAEEANRLLCRHGCTVDFNEDQQGDVVVNEPQGSNDGFPSGSGIIKVKGKKEQIKLCSTDSKGMIAATKKQKVAQAELEQNCKWIPNNAVYEQGATENFVERTMKRKKLAPKIQRTVNLAAVLKDKGSTLMAHSGCGDVGSDRGVCVDGLQDITLDGEVFLEAAFVNGSSNHQSKVSKQKHFVNAQGITLSKASGNMKRARGDFAKEPLSSFNLDLDHETQHFPEKRSVLSNGFLAECRQQAVTDKKNSASLATEAAQCASVEGTEMKDVTDEFRPLTNSGVNAPGNLSKSVNEDEGKTWYKNPNKLGDSAETLQSETCQPNVDNPGANPPSTSEVSEKGMCTVSHEETALLKRAAILNDGSSSVSLQKQIVRSGPSPSAGCLSDTELNKFSNRTSNSCMQTRSMCSFAAVTERCCRGVSGELKTQSSSLSWEAGLSQDLSCFQSVDNINAMHVSLIGTASVEVSSGAASAIMVNGCVPSGVSSSACAENLKLFNATNALEVRKCDPHVISWPRRADSPDISKVETPSKQSTLQASYVRAMSNSGELVGNEPLINRQEAMRAVRRDHLLIANRNAHSLSASYGSEGLQKVKSVMHSSVNAKDLTLISPNQRDYLGREVSGSCMVPMIPSAAKSGLMRQENCKLIRRNGALAPSQKLDLINQNLTFPSNLLIDATKTMADVADTGGAKDAVSHLLSIENSVALNNQQRSNNPSLEFAVNESHNMHEKITQIPMHEVANICNTKMGGGPTKPPIPELANQIVSASSSISTADYINLIPASLNGPGRVFSVPSNSPMPGEFSSAVMNPRRENSSRSDFTSRLNSYGGLNYPEEPGVVHIFGNPVFKLMGKNVMVTNKDAKSMGMGDPVVENGRGFHTAGSVCHLECMGTARGFDLLQDAYSRFPQPLVDNSIFMSQDMFASHAGACSQRNPSLTRDNHDIHPHAMQNAVLPTYGNVELSGYRSPAVPEPPISMAVSGETLRSFGSAVGVQLERQAVLKPANQTPAEVIVIDDSFPNSGTLMPSILQRNADTAIQQHGIPWLANPFSLSQEKAQIQNQSPAVLCRQEHFVSPDFLADLHKLGLNGSSSFHASNQPSGTLSDIVQSSDMSKDRLWSTLSGPMQ